MRWRRWIILAALLPIHTAMVAWILTAVPILLVTLTTGETWDALLLLVSPSEWNLNAPEFLLMIGVPTLILVGSQAMFLLPILRARPTRGALSRPLSVTLVAAGLVAAVLTVALAYGVIGLIQLARSSGTVSPEDAVPVMEHPGWHMALSVVLVGSWIMWSLILMAFARRKPGRNVLGRVIGLLLAGTIIEVIVVAPIDVMIRRRTDCYCAVGTFWSLSLSTWALLWLAGPGIIIALLSRRHRLWRDLHCEQCGYTKGPSPGEKCSECGFAWMK